MATIKIEIVAGGTTYTRTKTISAAHLTRFIAAERVMLNMTGAETDAAVAAAWADKVFDETKVAVLGVERGTAVDTVAAGVTPIDLT